MSSGAEYLRKTLTGGLLEPTAHISRSKEPRNEITSISKLDKKVQDDDDVFVVFIYASLLISAQLFQI